MKNIVLLTTLISLFFNSCKYPVSVAAPVRVNTPEKVIIYSNPPLTEFETYIVENTFHIYDTTEIFNGTFHTEFKNPSFEDDFSSHSRIPLYWKNCGDASASPVDIHGDKEKYFQVTHGASEGKNFIGMVARSEGNYEAIGQDVENPLTAGYTYSFSLFACRSPKYLSLSRTTLKEENSNTPAILKIYGGENCADAKLLVSTKIIEHTEWAEYVFVFDVKEEIKFILLEVNYEVANYPYNGNLLIDDISPIYSISR